MTATLSIPTTLTDTGMISVSRAESQVNESSRTILERVAGGEASAVRECLDHFGGLVWSLARRFSPSEADAEDAVQDIFIDVWKSAERYDPSVASEATFIAMIARRRLIDKNRARARAPQQQKLPEDSFGPSTNDLDTPELTDEARVAAQAMDELSAEQQRVLKLSIMYGLSHEKIAEATSLPLGTVKTHARRGLIKLRETLAKHQREVSR